MADAILALGQMSEPLQRDLVEVLERLERKEALADAVAAKLRESKA